MLGKSCAKAGVGAVLALTGCAASAAPPNAPAPTVSTTPELGYTSAWQGYRAWSDATPPGWRTSNETVARVGGWRAYLRQVREAAAPKTETAQ